MFFLLGGMGIIFASYGLYNAIQANSDGDHNGVLGIVIAALTMLLIIGGWIMRLKNVTP